MLRLCSVALVAIPTAVAQTTWTVSAAGGAQFTTIQAAVQAASDGDTILVQPTGTYVLDFTLTKGVAILGDGAPVMVNGLLTISGIAAGHRVALGNLQASSSISFASFRINVTGCSGGVHCEGLVLGGVVGPPPILTSHPCVTATNSALVTLHRCSAVGWPGVVVVASAFAASESAITGLGMDLFISANISKEAILANGSRVELTSCTLRGGPGHLHFTSNGANAMTCTATTVLAGATSFVGGFVTSPNVVPGSSIALDATSRLDHDSACLFPDGIVAAAPGSVAQVEMCRVNGVAAPPGGMAMFTFTGPSGDFAIVCLGLPTAPTTLPFGLAWLDLTSLMVLQVGLLPLPNVNLPVPGAVPRGLVFALQTAIAHQGIGYLSPPLATIVP